MHEIDVIKIKTHQRCIDGARQANGQACPELWHVKNYQ